MPDENCYSFSINNFGCFSHKYCNSFVIILINTCHSTWSDKTPILSQVLQVVHIYKNIVVPKNQNRRVRK